VAVSEHRGAKTGGDGPAPRGELAANQEADREIARRRAVGQCPGKRAEHRDCWRNRSRLHAQLRSLTHEILLTQEEERKRISRQLHDEFRQSWWGSMSSWMPLPWPRDDPRVLRQANRQNRRQVGKSIEVVHASRANYGPRCSTPGAHPALRSLVKEQAGAMGLAHSFHCVCRSRAADSLPSNGALVAWPRRR